MYSGQRALLLKYDVIEVANCLIRRQRIRMSMLKLEEGGNEAKRIKRRLTKPGIYGLFGCLANENRTKTIVKAKV
jgi:hypothetical protein